MNTKEFRAAVGKETTQPKRSNTPTAIVDELVRITAEAVEKARSIGIRGDEVRDMRSRLVREAEERWMLTRYPALDLSFADEDKKRYVRLGWQDGSISLIENVTKDARPKQGEIVAGLPVFVQVWEDLHHFAEKYNEESRNRMWDKHFECGTLPPRRVDGVSYGRQHVTAFVRAPEGITPAMLNSARRCMAYLKMFDVALLDRGVDTADYRDDRSITVGVLWAPADSAWSFTSQAVAVRGDPAILVRRGSGTAYLVGYYDTPNEKPIDNLIREFSRGRKR